ncbi:MAG: DUF1287 domain-containing protein [Ottowia sp.]
MLLGLLGPLASATQPVAQADDFATQLDAAALNRLKAQVRYDGRYVAIAYPGGDVPADTGVCTDVVIRSYRALGVDLQVKVHEDMRQNFARYPSQRLWGLSRPDPHIDHRRVPNLQVFFKRHGQALPTSDNPASYRPGDLVTWMLPGNLPHIGIVSSKKTRAGVPLIVHNIGRGPELSDALFVYKITGHYRYQPKPV